MTRPDYHVTLGDTVHGLDTDLDWHGHMAWTWHGPTPACPACGDPLSFRDGTASVGSSGPYQPFALDCDCGASVPVTPA